MRLPAAVRRHCALDKLLTAVPVYVFEIEPGEHTLWCHQRIGAVGVPRTLLFQMTHFGAGGPPTLFARNHRE
jgi:hypothetical protein